MTEENKDTPPPQLVIDKLPPNGDLGVHYRWRLEYDGMPIAQGNRFFPTNWDAARDASQVSLCILGSLSSSYCRLASEVSQAREQASEAQRQAMMQHKATPDEGNDQ